MANYRAHTSFNLCIMFPVAIYILSNFLRIEKQHIYIFVVSFVFGTFFMNPDVDMAHKVKLFSLRGFFSLPFWPYSFIFRHRGISHSLFLGTFTRVCWLFLLGTTIYYFTVGEPPNIYAFLSFIKAHKTQLKYAFFGLFFADCSHLLLDRKIL